LLRRKQKIETIIVGPICRLYQTRLMQENLICHPHPHEMLQTNIGKGRGRKSGLPDAARTIGFKSLQNTY
jgi:hypothetical protein